MNEIDVPKFELDVAVISPATFPSSFQVHTGPSYYLTLSYLKYQKILFLLVG